MATTSISTSNALAVKKWSRDLMVEALKGTHAFQFMGTGADSIIQIKNEVKDVGDKITFGLRMQLSGDGISGDSDLEGNEEALSLYSDAVIIDQLRHAVRSAGKMTEQRIAWSIRNEAKMALADWWADRIDTAFFNQVAGNSGESDVRLTGMQAATAPTNEIFAGSNTTESGVAGDSSATFTLDLVDQAVEMAKTNSPKIRPVRIGRDKFFVMFLHPYQVTDLRTNTSTGQWLDIQKAAMAGMQSSKNPIFSGALGVYNGVVLHENTRIPTVVANSRRAVFCGAQAAAIAFGRESGKNTYSWEEDLFDYNNQLGVAAGSKWGLKKTVFNSADFASIVVYTYAVAHT